MQIIIQIFNKGETVTHLHVKLIYYKTMSVYFRVINNCKTITDSYLKYIDFGNTSLIMNDE